MLTHINGNLWIAIDMILAIAGLAIAYRLNPFPAEVASVHLHPGWHTALFVFGIVAGAHVFGLHHPHLDRDSRGMMVKVFFVVILASVFVLTAAGLVFFDRIGRHILFLSAGATWVLLVATRIGFWRLTRQHRPRIGLLGTDIFYERAQIFLQSHARPITVKSLPTSEQNLGDWALEQKLDEVIVHAAALENTDQQLLDCLDRGIPVRSYSEFVEQHYRLVPVEEIDSRWFLNTAMEGVHPHFRIAKRFLDIAVALVGFVFAAPILILAAILIRLESPGNIFYSQVRVGLHNRQFRIYKLRTMRNDAEKNGKAQWAKQGDARVTKVGKFLRKTRIDELPQFWNILRGDMAFIGPRPERPEFTDDLSDQIPFYEKRHMVKPGLTGWAQINYPYGASVDDARNKLKYDLYYVKNACLELDLHIVVRTIGAIMKGAR
ncbi:MAG: sugar transferase [Verrucomicrobiota bacterium]